MSFDMGANYDIATKEHAIHDWHGLRGGLRDEIQPLAFYLCFILVGTSLGFKYIHGSMLYVFL